MPTGARGGCAAQAADDEVLEASLSRKSSKNVLASASSRNMLAGASSHSLLQPPPPAPSDPAPSSPSKSLGSPTSPASPGVRFSPGAHAAARRGSGTFGKRAEALSGLVLPGTMEVLPFPGAPAVVSIGELVGENQNQHLQVQPPPRPPPPCLRARR